MFRKHELVPSQAMGRRMHLWRYGHFGVPLLVFPSAAGMAHEWEAHGMVEALADFLDAGRIKLYCAESNVAEAWTRKESDPEWRMGRHRAYEHYVVHELAPLIRQDCRSDDIRIAVAGTSLGAFYSANFVLKFPLVFNWGMCMSGRYDATWLTGGFDNQDVYFNNPMGYVPNLHGGELQKVRDNAHLVLICGQGKWEDGNIEETNRFAAVLASKGISHEHDMWGLDVTHDWIWWKRQARHHVAKSFG